MRRNMVMRPWEGARAQDRTGLAALLLFMQVSLVLWPAAIRVAHRLEREHRKQLLLNKLVALHTPALHHQRLSASPMG